MIFCCLSMKKHKVSVDMINKSILFSLKYCSNPESSSVLVLTMPRVDCEIIFLINQQDVLSHQILKSALEKK